MWAVCASGRRGIGMAICTIGAAVHIPTSHKTSSGHGCIFACCHQRMETRIGRVEGGRKITRIFNLCRICTGKFSQTVGHISPCAAIRNTAPTFRQVGWQSGVAGMTLQTNLIFIGRLADEVKAGRSADAVEYRLDTGRANIL